jgi:hypothetical protein
MRINNIISSKVIPGNLSIGIAMPIPLKLVKQNKWNDKKKSTARHFSLQSSCFNRNNINQSILNIYAVHLKNLIEIPNPAQGTTRCIINRGMA